MIFQMACLSAWANDTISEAEIHQIFEGSAIRNTLAAITGVLFCSENSFFHIVEGAEEELRALEARLENDWRIRSVKRVAFEKIASRCFDEWSVVVEGPRLIPGEGCSTQCNTCPQASICSVAEFRERALVSAARLPKTTRVMLDWFFRIQLKQNGLEQAVGPVSADAPLMLSTETPQRDAV